jgi:two-component system CheB/CheR fusion protein
VQALPLLDDGHAVLGVKVIFTDVTRFRELRTELDRSKQELETAYEELQSSNEELETTNEELQSTVEELETTNEELQSTNEELETMNEELQSTNEELEATNQESRVRSEDLNQLNTFLQSILSVMHVGAAVVNRDLRIDLWNSVAEELWGIREDEVLGNELTALDIGLPVDQLAVAIRRCFLEGSEQNDFEVDAVNRRGRTLRCKVTLLPSRLTGDHDWKMIVLMEEVNRDVDAK